MFLGRFFLLLFDLGHFSHMWFGCHVLEKVREHFFGRFFLGVEAWKVGLAESESLLTFFSQITGVESDPRFGLESPGIFVLKSMGFM